MCSLPVNPAARPRACRSNIISPRQQQQAIQACRQAVTHRSSELAAQRHSHAQRLHDSAPRLQRLRAIDGASERHAHAHRTDRRDDAGRLSSCNRQSDTATREIPVRAQRDARRAGTPSDSTPHAELIRPGVFDIDPEALLSFKLGMSRMLLNVSAAW
jgi:hypothetical protein